LNPHRGEAVVQNTIVTSDRTRQYTYPVNAAAGYDVVVKVTRNDGCVSTANARIRVSGGLTSAVSSYDAGDICIGRTDVITVGGSVGGEPSVITVEPEPYSIVANAGQGVRTFIPDGFACDTRCYTSSATFNDFVEGSKVTSGEDIVYLKINMEHTFIGDMQIKLKCPEDENHVVREMIILQDYLNTDSHNTNPLDPSVYDNGLDDDSYTWLYRDPVTNRLSKLYFGEPNTSDGTGSSICTESSNPAGVGYDYCWTNTATTYVYEAQNHEEVGSYHRVKASNMNGLIQTYKPWQPFDNLIGCPLNGTWEISVCDGFAIDNGYVFNWELSLKKEFTPAPWNYVVYVDSLRVTVPPADQSFVTVDASTLLITPDFDAALGSHNANLFIVDNFGCNVNNGAAMPITYNVVNTVNTVFNISLL
jgi:subtilisin-like proprotein convertase family protein